MTIPSPAPGVPRTQAAPAAAPPGRQWPGSAKIVVVVLAVTTLAVAVAGVLVSSSATSNTDDVEKDLAQVRKDLAQVRDDLEQAQDGRDSAEKQAAQVRAEVAAVEDELATTRSERDAATDGAEAVRALFPLDSTSFAEAPLQGAYSLEIDEGLTECTGYADDVTACAAASLPGGLLIDGDSDTGYTVSSSHFSTTPLTRDRSRFTASGTVDADVADLCDGEVVPTAFTVSFSVARVGLDDNDTLEPVTVLVEYTMGAEGSPGCAATTRKVVFTGTPA